jgi:CDGSH-type Zn-finger protein
VTNAALPIAKPDRQNAAMKVTVLKNGPLRVEGDDIQLVDPEGTSYGLGGRTVVSLCRCGQSQNKPFCDGSHNHHGFQDEPVARELPPKKT